MKGEDVENPLHLSEAVREMHACEWNLRLSESLSEKCSEVMT